MRTDYQDHGSNTEVYATGSATYDISTATVYICLHDDVNADTWLAATWSTTPTYNATTGKWSGEARTTSAIDFSAKALGKYVVKIKVGTEITQCYILHVIP